MSDFESFGKIPRYSRGCVITEKLDGTNAQIYLYKEADGAGYISDHLHMKVGSRNRWITPQDDNFGFAMWAEQNKQELLKLGEGRHFGEWWGTGIQRGYHLSEKRFSLFNAGKWLNDDIRPKCCHVVPVIVTGDFKDSTIEFAMEELRNKGSFASPGFMKPEGIVIYHKASNSLFKKTLDNDESPKGQIE